MIVLYESKDLTIAYMMGASDEKEKWRNKIKAVIEELDTWHGDPKEVTTKSILQDLLKE